ncbi:Ig-like domain-containing protein [Halosquirtibacter laminarini]|uniref:Ig-like domain-containing protein n=1 Tax=Halosquirtibacter laminarini TaxID=3374600 RepID=A0AC61NN15_9BACT|nr:Ig-like domain-containing protein [Prolixibacteraceae bacterium]
MRHSFCSYLLLLVALFLLYSCGNSEKESNKQESISNLISFVSTNNVSTQGPIVIEFSEIVKDASIDLDKVIDLSPNFNYKSQWIANQKLVLTPTEKLKPSTAYDVTLDLKRLYPNASEVKPYKFKFVTLVTSFKVDVQSLECDPNNPSKMICKGVFVFNDAIKKRDVEDFLSIEKKGDFDIKWNHNGQKHYFEISNIIRKSKEYNFTLNWNGNSKDIDIEGSKTLVVPIKGDFKFQSMDISTGGSPVITLTFSDVLAPEQNLKGLIYLKGCKLGTSIVGNKLVVYPDKLLAGEQYLKVNSAIKSLSGKRMVKSLTIAVNFTPSKPKVQFVRKGNIIPNASGFKIPFRAINLDAVYVRIVRVFQKNIPFFLQSTSLNSSTSSVRRFGRIVYEGKMTLDGVEVNKYKTFALNIPDIIEVKPNEIYQVNIGIRPNYSIYPCKNLQELRDMKLEEVQDKDFWNGDNWSESNYYSKNNLYNWRKSDDPSHPSYYSPSKAISRYVISSNIGLIVKKEEDNNYYIAATDLLSSKPKEGVEIKILNFQNQVISTGETDTNGFLRVKTRMEGCLVLAKKFNDWGFLKINSDMQEVSDFNVSGYDNKSEVSAFIYGERDVWRPGDSIYVSSVIRDESKKLEDNYPVIFELYDSKGVLKDKNVQTKKGSIISYRTATNVDDPVGNWLLKMKVAGNTYSKVLRIETIRPNRMKILWENEPKYIESKRPQINFDVKWLHGAPAKGHKMIVNTRIRRKSINLKGFHGYWFRNEAASNRSSYFKSWEGKTDESGKAKVLLDLDLKNVKEPLVAMDLESRVFEDGGAATTTTMSKDFYPFKKFCGVKLSGVQSYGSYYDTEKDIRCDLVVLNTQLKYSKGTVRYYLYKVDYSWWWNAESSSSLAKYVDDQKYTPFKRGVINVAQGKGSFSFRMKNNEWGRYLLVAKLSNGNTVSKLFFCDWPGGEKSDNSGQTLLSLNVKKDRLVKGEDISLMFPSENGGHALISIERGGRVIKQSWVQTTEKNTIVTIPTGETMTPNIYLYVTYIQPYQNVKNDRPIRLYGIKKIHIEDPNSKLSPEIECNDEVRAKKDIHIKVSEANKKEIDYTIAVVDEGLLGITNYRTPSPWNYFNQDLALRVSTWDLYDDILGMYAGKMGRLIPVGGDGMLKDPSKNKAKRFKPVVLFAGPFHLDKGEKAEHHFKIPAYTGEVRVMVIAANDDSYGSSQKQVKVVDPLMILADAPRTLDLNEKFLLPITLFTNKKMTGKISVHVEVKGELKLDGTDDLRTEMGNLKEKDLAFKLKTTNTTGKGEIIVTAKCGDYNAQYKIEMEVDNSNPIQYETVWKKLNPKQKISDNKSMLDNCEGERLVLSASTMMVCNIGKRLDQLIVYPHGCLEQTVSSVFPQLLLLQSSQLNKENKEKMIINVQNALSRLLLFQHSDGSFSYWPGSNYNSKWASCYAGHFLVMAKKAGYFIPGDMLKRWTRHQLSMANRWRSDETKAVQAYCLFVLSLAGEAPLGVMNRLREDRELKTPDRWLLASAYAQIGRMNTAESLFDFRDLSTVTYPLGEKNVSFGSQLRDKSLLLLSLNMLGREDIAFPLAVEISKELSSDRWMSTQTTSFALLAVQDFMKSNTNHVETSSLSVNIGSKTMKTDISPQTDIIYQGTWSNKENIEVVNSGNSPVFAAITKSFKRTDISQKASSNGLSLRVVLVDDNDKVVQDTLLVQGKDYKLKVYVKNISKWNLKNLALRIPMPSGAEILNRSDVLPESCTFQQILDDEVREYLNINRNKSVSITIPFNASFKGYYKWPSISVEAMYNHQFNASTDAKMVSIK